MLGKADHVAYVARNLERGVSTICAALGLEVMREFQLPEFALRGAFLGNGEALVEVFELLEPALSEPRLGEFELQLDHVAYEVGSLEETASLLRAIGVRFSGPDGKEVIEPIELGGSRHLWTIREGRPLRLGLQLIERLN